MGDWCEDEEVWRVESVDTNGTGLAAKQHNTTTLDTRLLGVMGAYYVYIHSYGTRKYTDDDNTALRIM